ncbi:hypothetical protein ACFOY2_07220 [Nonomuraea purpurea]|uniref:Uncharacterized protein n=1 Tax=Nonomuraea purpurea TaxID=1849276 RepID=A0ABV8G449_9ACTN
MPCTAAGLRTLRERGVVTPADFVCGAGATIGYHAEMAGGVSDAASARALVEERIGGLTASALEHPDGPYAGSCAVAEAFLATWRDPDGPPLAPDTTATT